MTTERVVPLAEGFPGQRIRVLPPPLVARAARASVTSRLLVTDLGYFPRAAGHGRSRPRGAAETIVIVCVDGAGWFESPSARCTLRAGEAVIVPALVPHRYGSLAEDPWTIWWLHLLGTDVADLVQALGGSPDEASVIAVRDLLAVVGLFESALAAMERDETWASLYAASGCVWHLLTQLAASRLRGARRTEDRILDALEYLRAYLALPVRLTDLARSANLSVSHFSALFREATGTSVIDYVRRLRISRARELLVTTDRSITEIARAVGYADPFYFTRQFRAVDGVSPSEFRRRSRHEES
ncbi:AraC family transcriptional regulator [Virgisporangium aurantiacum]|uniref:AraC family transcriptional regulator n=1 Tax=Virgisporangium aurantiacum TaxID=175570 RepID=UPI00194FDD25|nr:AraC family transcriptional regulator [Virgisporangium aurantiacum]